MDLIIYGETPAKKNSRMYLSNGRNIPSARYRAWHTSALLQLRPQKEKAGQQAIDYPVIVTLRFFHGDKRRRDSDNGTSSILDTLTDVGILADDNWEIVRALNVYNYYDKGNARCEVNIAELKGL